MSMVASNWLARPELIAPTEIRLRGLILDEEDCCTSPVFVIDGR